MIENVQQFLGLSTVWLLINLPGCVCAQSIIPDNTLPNSSVVTPNGNVLEITGGTVDAENLNLFHSFEQFSLLNGETAFFNNATTIENIITRVTGESLSDLDGLIRANGTANLFLINPNGISFGENASLDIGGSFIGSTADSLQFSGDSEFSAVAPQAPPLLNINVPLGLQYGSNPGQIQVAGTGNGLFVDLDLFNIVRDFRPVGLQVQTGQTLALIGGELLLDGGNLTAEEGRIELGSVGANSTVLLTSTNPGWRLDYDSVDTFQDITLSQAASVDTSGEGGGEIQVQGQQITLTDGSALLNITLGDSPGGDLIVTASEGIEVSGGSLNADSFVLLPSGFLTEVTLNAMGSGGNLTIATPSLSVRDGAQISVTTFGAGDAGTLSVNAQDIELVGESVDTFFASGLFGNADIDATGTGGTILVDTGNLLVSDGARIISSTFGTGNGGNVTVRANSVQLVRESEFGASGLFSNAELGSNGTGGTISIETESLQISDGAQISATTFGTGDGGSVTIQSNEIVVTGNPLRVFPSGIFADVSSLNFTEGITGTGGEISIQTERLQINNGGQVATGTFSDGNAGTLTVQAEEILLTGRNDSGRSGLFANAIAGTGDGGDVVVSSDRLTVQDGATISVSNFPSSGDVTLAGQGSAGNVQLQSTFLLLNNEGILTAEANNGDQGNIIINSEDLRLRQGSQINTNAQGTATGGNITIDTDTLIALENSDITANSIGNFGGRVIITANSVFGTTFRETLTSFSDITASSSLGAAFNGVVEINAPDIDPFSILLELPVDPLDAGLFIDRGCAAYIGNEFVISGRGGLPEDPTHLLIGGSLWKDERNVSTVNTQSTTASIIVEAQGWLLNHEGTIELVAIASQVTPQPPSLPVNNWCSSSTSLSSFPS